MKMSILGGTHWRGLSVSLGKRLRNRWLLLGSLALIFLGSIGVLIQRQGAVGILDEVQSDSHLQLAPAEAWRWVEEGAQAIDVREPHEFAQERVPRFKNIPLSELSQRLNEISKEERVVLLCRSGRRSSLAAQELLRAGFAGDKVANVEGGLLRWKSENLPIESGLATK